MTTCCVRGCEQLIRYKAGQLCNVHYQRQKRLGSFHLPTLMDRFMAKVQISGSGCWIWIGATHIANGLTYGKMMALGEWEAHRVAYRLFKGDIPDGFHIDHTCCNTICVNPDHLEAVTPQGNCQRTVERNRHRWAGYEPQPCCMEGCDTPASAKGLCKSHYMKGWKAGKRLAEMRA